PEPSAEPEPSEEPADPATDPAAGAAPAVGPGIHEWGRIHFVSVRHAFGPGTELEAYAEREQDGLRVSLLSRQAEPTPFAQARLRMHLPAGPIDPSPPSGLGLSGTSGRGTIPIYQHHAHFAWQGNTMDEAFVEVDLGARGRFWLELPYGFTRDPSLPLPDDPRTTARLPAAIGARDRIVPFRHVRYELGEIENGWRLSANVSNPFDAHVELELYREPGGEGSSVYRWALDEPRTSATIVAHGGAEIRSLRILARLHEDGLRRSDHFHFFRRPAGGRAWGTLRAVIDGRAHEIRIPSSLYLYTHGTADPYDARRVVNAAQVLGEGLF
ncbi:MAG: hypothetical protein K8H88_17020, partial [Sandaracinaceae bacterium]|nr:hypothetical protein [Sandaracinaceae bacterium]